jgi:peroxiredoxin
MAQLEPLKDDIAAVGAELTYIAAEKRNGIYKPAKYLEKNPISYPFLLDEDRTATKAYGLYHGLGMDALNIAHPATLVVDQERSVRYIYRGENQHDRAPAELVMAALRGLRRV